MFTYLLHSLPRILHKTKITVPSIQHADRPRTESQEDGGWGRGVEERGEGGETGRAVVGHEREREREGWGWGLGGIRSMMS